MGRHLGRIRYHHRPGLILLEANGADICRRKFVLIERLVEI